VSILNPSIFREYDIRGVAERDLTDDTVASLGRAFGTFLQRKGLAQVLVGMDNRLSSPRLKNTLVKGLLSTGCEVVDLGTVTTPILADGRGQADGEAWLSLASEALQQEDGRLIERDLRGLLVTARDMADKNDWVGAGTVCQAILTALAENYEDIQELDEEGEIAVFGGESVELMEECLSEGNGEGRAGWFAALLAAELADLGGIDLAPGAFDLIVEHTSAEEWAPLEVQIRAAMVGGGNRAYLGERLTAWQTRAQERVPIIKETGPPEQVMFLMIKEGKAEEALTMARENFLYLPEVIARVVDQLVTGGLMEQAVDFVTGLSEEDPAHGQLLIEYHLSREEWGKALELQTRDFLRQPSADSFLAVSSTAQKTDDWERIRLQLLHVLEGEKRWPELLAIALVEGEASRALELYSRVSPSLRWNYRKDLAHVAEEDFPAEAAALYREMAQEHIRQQRREAYREAARCLVRAKALFERTGDRWEEYMAGLKARYPRHKTLWEELRSAGL